MISKKEESIAINTASLLSQEWGEANLLESVNQKIEELKITEKKPPSTEECIELGIGIAIASLIVTVAGVALQAYDIFFKKNKRKPTSGELEGEILPELNRQISVASPEERKKIVRVTEVSIRVVISDSE